MILSTAGRCRIWLRSTGFNTCLYGEAVAYEVLQLYTAVHTAPPPFPHRTRYPPAQVRQRGRDALQRALFERAEGRFKARTVGTMTANLCGLLMTDLDTVKGRKIPYASVGGWGAGCALCPGLMHAVASISSSVHRAYTLWCLHCILNPCCACVEATA